MRQLDPEKPPTPPEFVPFFRCHRGCGDTGFLLRTDDLGRTWGRHCECLAEEIEAARQKAQNSIPFGKGRSRRVDPDIPF